MWESEFQSLVSGYFDSCRETNAKFSLRSLARRFQVSPSTLSDLLNGRRAVSEKKALQMMEMVPDMDARRARAVREGIAAAHRDPVVLAKKDYDLLLNWLNFGVLCSLELENAPGTEEEVAKLLGVAVPQVEACVERLNKADMVTREDGVLKLTGSYFATEDNIQNDDLVKAHLNDMPRAAQALKTLSVEERDFTSVIVVGDSRKMAMAKLLTRRFLNKFCDVVKGTTADEIFKISVQIYPLTQKAKE